MAPIETMDDVQTAMADSIRQGCDAAIDVTYVRDDAFTISGLDLDVQRAGVFLIMCRFPVEFDETTFDDDANWAIAYVGSAWDRMRERKGNDPCTE